MTSPHPLDAPLITSNLFFPRPAQPHLNPDANDGTITVADGVALGYRFYRLEKHSPVMLYFHGNGEVASDYDGLAPYYHHAGVSLLVVDYRGYGWSDGTPSTSQMLPDALKVVEALPDVLRAYDVNLDDVALFVKGRSLGSAPAIYVAYQAPERFKGLILESGYADAPSLFARLGIALASLLPGVRGDMSLPIYNAEKLKQVHLPLLVIHGSHDTLIPVTQGKMLHEASPAADKTLLIIEGAGHNNLLARGPQDYFAAIRQFVYKLAPPKQP